MAETADLPALLWSLLRAGQLHRLRLRRRARADDWRELKLRPILLRDERCWQFVYSYPRRDHSENLSLAEALDRLRAHLDERPRSLVLETATERIVAQFNRRGQAQLSRQRRASPRPPPDLAHDRQRAAPLPADRPDPFLMAIGVMTANGRIRARQRDKFRQINEFLRQLEHARADKEDGQPPQEADRRPLQLLDCACGSATLSFAAQHYLAAQIDRPVALVGIDRDEALVDKARARADELRAAGAGSGATTFVASDIRDYRPAAAPDILLALHACDTATDEALALGVGSGAPLLLAAPCCHHHLQAQLAPVPPFAALQRQGILAQRLGDLLTDTLRALALEVMGYRCQALEFIGSEHTDRNLMLRARRRVREDAAARKRAAQEYRQLTRFWGVRPHIEELLGAEFAARLAAAD